MTFEELQKANESILTTTIEKTDRKTGKTSAKEYAEVNQRIKVFRMLYPNGCISTNLLSNENGVCIFRAEVSNEGELLGTGTAYEKEDSSFINKTSYIENCETSAVGRALAMCGIGIDVSIASKEEVENAKLNQDKPVKAPAKEDQAIEEAKLKARVIGYVNRHQMSQEDIQKICKCYKIESLQELTKAQCEHYINVISKRGGNIDE